MMFMRLTGMAKDDLFGKLREYILLRLQFSITYCNKLLARLLDRFQSLNILKTSITSINLDIEIED